MNFDTFANFNKKHVITIMFKEIINKALSGVFLFIFLVKMIISVAPVLIDDMDEKSVYTVIMQLEIEHESPKGAEAKWEEIQSLHQFSFALPAFDVLHFSVSSFVNNPVQSFYPSVPTPPPNV